MADTPVQDETMLLPEAAGDAAAAPATSPLGGRLPADALSEGVKIGEYRVERLLGEGGMGQVYAARQPVIGKRVAIKILKSAFSKDAELVRRFVGEARAVNKIGHPNIIDIFSFGQLPDGRQYFVMEFLEGETLGERLQRQPLEREEARRLLLQACQALEAAHREKIIHRDLKPENLWIARPRHGEPFIKVLDFGIAKLIETEMLNVTQTGVTMGTPMYMSPEQCIGQNVDHRTDIYAMGAILFQVFAGRLPFQGHTFAEVVAQQLTATPPRPSQFRAMPPALEQVILGCLEKDAAQRPQTAAELAILLEAALSPTATPAAPLARTMVLEVSASPAVPVETRQGFAGHDGAPAANTPVRPAEQPAGVRSSGRPGRWVLLVAAVVGGTALLVAAIVGLLGRDDRQRTVASPPPIVAPVRAPAAAPSPPPPAPPVAVPATPSAPADDSPPPPRPAARPAPIIKRSGTVDESTAPAASPRRPRRVDDPGLVKDNPY